MATEILRLQDCVPSRRRRHHQPSAPRRPDHHAVDQVRILKQAEPRQPAPVKIRSNEPTVADVYAGSAFSQSPSPRLLPMPSFSHRKPPAAVDDSATKDLRRLLRLD